MISGKRACTGLLKPVCCMRVGSPAGVSLREGTVSTDDRRAVADVAPNPCGAPLLVDSVGNPCERPWSGRRPRNPARRPPRCNRLANFDAIRRCLYAGDVGGRTTRWPLCPSCLSTRSGCRPSSNPFRPSGGSRDVQSCASVTMCGNLDLKGPPRTNLGFPPGPDTGLCGHR